MNEDEGLVRIARVAGWTSAVVALLNLAALPVTPLHTYPRDALLMRAWVAFAVLSMGLSVVGLARRPDPRRASGATALIAASILGTALLSLFAHTIGEAWPARSPTLPSGVEVVLADLAATPLRSGTMLVLAASSLLLSSLAAAPGAAATLGALMVTMGSAFVLGLIYGGSILTDVRVPVRAGLAVAAIVLGTGLTALGGPAVLPNRLFVGSSVRAVMLRWQLPFVALAIIVTDIASIYVFSGFSHAIGSTLNTLASLVVAGIVTSYLARIVGRRLELSQAALRRSQERFMLVFTSVPIGLAISRLDDGRFLEVNQEFERIYRLSRERVLGRTSIELDMWLEPADRDDYARRLASAEGPLRGVELRLRRSDGRELVVRNSAYIMENEGERLLVSAFTDITDLVQAEKQRRAAEQRYTQLVNDARDVIFSLTADGTITSLNQAFEHTTGLPVADWIGRSYLEVLHPDDRDRGMAELAEMLRGTPVNSPPVRILRAQGGHLYGEIRVSAHVADGQVVGITGIGRDVSDRVQLEEEIQHLQRREVRSLFDSARDAMLIRVENGYVAANPAALERYGYATEAELLVIPVGGLSAPTQKGGPTSTELYQQTVRENLGKPFEWSFMRKDRSTFLGEIQESPITFGGKPATLYLVRDVSEARRQALALQAANEELRRSESAVALARDAAEAATRAKSAFLANMSHEIRTPMNAILGYAQLLRRDPALQPEHKTKVEVIQRSGDHLLTIINDILEMSKIEAGRATVTTEAFDPTALLRDVALMFDPLATARGLALVFERHDDWPGVVLGDAAKVRQVLLNLLSNAIKFTSRGGVRVRARSIPVGDATVRFEIEVEDTGPGIDAQQQSRLFVPFEQGSSTSHTGGTGLGLAISRSHARLMNGDLTLRSTVGQGSTFTFAFPCTVTDDVSLVLHPTRVAPLRLSTAHRGITALVVDDIATNRDLLRELLGSCGFEVRTASSGEEALEIEAAWHPRLILMDIRMPGIGGIEAVRRLRASGCRAGIIAITASVQDVHKGEIRAAGADAQLLKPFEDAALFAHIADLLGVAFDESEAKVQRERASEVALRDVLSELSPDVLAELHTAAVQARPREIAALCDRLTEHAPEAARRVRTHLESFDYGSLLDALTAPGGDP